MKTVYDRMMENNSYQKNQGLHHQTKMALRQEKSLC